MYGGGGPLVGQPLRPASRPQPDRMDRAPQVLQARRDQRRARGAEDYFCCMRAAISASALRGEDRDVEEPSESKDAEKCYERRHDCGGDAAGRWLAGAP